MTDDKLNSWLGLRFDYYLAGRTLLFTNQIQTSVLMFGYAIEAHFKQLLSSDPLFKKKLQFGHGFLGAYNKLKDNGFLTGVRVSEDLLHFAEDNFHRRYPTQKEQTIERANNRDALLHFDNASTIVHPGADKESWSRAAELFEYPGQFRELPDGTRISVASF